MESVRMHPGSLVFAPREIEAAYFDHHFPVLQRQTRLTLIVATILYVMFGFLDPWVVPEVKQTIWVIRAAVSAYFALVFVVTYTPFFKKWTLAAMTSVGVVGGTGILIMLVLASDSGAQLYYAGLILVMNGTFLMLGLPFIYGMLICLYVLIAYEFIALGLRETAVPVLVNNNFFLIGSFVIAGFTGYSLERYTRRSFYQTRIAELEQAKTENLLLNILPKEIARTLKEQNGTIADYFEEATILFADIADFTALAAQLTPSDMVTVLNEVFSYFDSLIERYGLEKVKTIGDAYMVAAGVPRQRPDHAEAAAAAALEMRSYLCKHAGLALPELSFRVGIHSGPVVAGVIGRKKFQYDMWGDVVNTASRMQSHGEAGRIQITRNTYNLLKDKFVCEYRGPIQIKGKGEMETWFLVDRRHNGAGGSAG